ncbi:Pmd1p [Nakaseomyces bracarensis]|uniref:Pmd1p n=1 Tax=Nakaseomyces bracarensis TaxID=273131 RepID=UPI003872762A
MSLLLPSACVCYPLHLPTPSQNRNRSNLSLNEEVRSPTKTKSSNDVEMDEVTKKRITLDVRTGSASILTRSNIYVNGGLTIPLNLTEINSSQLQKELMLYFAKEKNKSISFKNLNEWISSETFFLDLISRTWRRMETTVADTNANDETTIKSNGRLFHSICFDDSNLYVFGGLMISPQNEYEFVATNDLWKLDVKDLKWSLVSRDPQIGRRYNHNMHILNANDPTKDTKIIIVGGLDNMDQPVCNIDIYNITKGMWETMDKNNNSDHDRDKDKTHHKNNPFNTISMSTNIDGKPAYVAQGNSFSVLLDNNGEDNNVIPTIGFYSSAERKQSSSQTEKKKKKKKKSKKSKSIGHELNFELGNGSLSDSSKPDEENDYQSPIIMLPMIPKAKGTRLYSRKLKNYSCATVSDDQDKSIPYNLLYPSGDSISCSIISSGFHNNTKASNLHCFVYNVCSCTWTKLCLNCQDSSINKHRFWKVFVWKSHHQAILLGTHSDDGYLPSVQKFDYLISISLPMLNGFNRILHEITPNTNIQKKTSLRIPLTPLSMIEHSTHSQPISPISSPNLENIPDPLDSKRNMSLASNQTSQFENYIRYITDPLELESTSSVFPPYAMVLGKDSLEIFGKSLADFEFVTSEGETIGVPMFLLRKRWGRYFDKLIALGYSNVCEDYRSNGVESTLIKMGSENNPVLNPYTSKTISTKLQNIPTKENNDDMKIKVEKRKTQDAPPAEIITSSSSGMVFRVPFKGCDDDKEHCDLNNGTTSPTTEEKTLMINMQKSKRTSSLVVPGPLKQRQNSVDSRIQSRRLSHPAKLPNGDLIDEYHPGLKHIRGSNKGHYSRRRLSNHSSRKASVVSQGSLLSFVSSSSDRLARTNSRKNSAANMSGASSPKISPLMVNLPPLTQEPSESLPIPPLPTNYSMFQALNSVNSNRRNSHNLDHIYNDKSSAGASRRSSFTQTQRYSISSDPRYSITSDRSFGHSEEGGNHQKSSIADKDKRAEGPYIHMRRGSSCSSEGRSERSSSNVSKEDLPDNGVDIEPLLLPRSLYMPWPAASVRAFAEFFYTGQINGKWPLSPVTLDLWVMAKVYEIRLLYDLITEVLYSIVGKKEGSILVNCNSLIDLFVSKVNGCYDDNERAKAVIFSNDAFKKLIELRDAVRDIESGFIDTTLMDKQTRLGSFSTYGSTYTDGLDGIQDRKLSLSSNNLNKHFRSMHNNIQNSQNQRSIWKSNQDVRTGSIAIPEDCPEASILQQDYNHSKSMDELNENHVSHPDIKTELFEHNMSDTHLNKTLEIEEQIEQARLQNLSDIGLVSGTASPLTNKRNDSVINHSVLTADTESLLSSASDSDDLDFLHSEIPLNMMDMKVREEKNEFEGSIDPLFKMSNSKQSSLPSEQPRNNNQSVEDIPVSTLENMMSPNALPPVDHVMKYIYRTSVLVNDGGLILRSTECIEFSKKLKKLKTVLTNDILKLEEDIMMAPVPTNKNILGELNLDSFQKFDSEPNIGKPSNASRPPLGGKTMSHTMDPFRKGSVTAPSKVGQSTISPRTSASPQDMMVNANSMSMTNIYSGNNFGSGISNLANNNHGSRQKKNSRFNSQTSTGLSILMNPAVMPPPPPSSPSTIKPKKDSSVSNGPLSFLGIKK